MVVNKARAAPLELCQYKGCKEPVKYAIYQLMPGGTKIWGHYCKAHDKIVAQENAILRKQNLGKVFVESTQGNSQ